jgi:NAD(P)-dependent dehydrogenase (short-subunit alcohol dehydrogenase family)
MSQISLKGDRAIVTGAGRGLGRSYALELARRGARVLVNDLARENADAVVAEIAALGGTAIADYEAIGSKESGLALVSRAIHHWGGLEILVNNAGILRPGYFEALSPPEIDAVLETHLLGTIYVTQAAWPTLRAQKYGRVMVTSSSTGMLGNQGQSNYAAAKAGAFGLAKALAYEGEQHNIQVNVLLPYAATVIHAKNPIPDIVENYARFVSPDLRERLARANHEPDMTAHLVAYLASRECAVSGEAYSVCYGRFARVFVAVADGWLSKPGEVVSAELVRDNFAKIRDTTRSSVPRWLFEEVADVARRL